MPGFDIRLPSLIAYQQDDEALEILKNTSHLDTLVDGKGKTLLHIAAENGNYKVTQYLIESGANVDAQDRRGKTPLMRAVRFRNTFQVVDLLLNNNASIHIRENKRGRNAFQLAHFKMRSEILQKVSQQCSGVAEKIAEKFVKWGCCISCSFELRNAELTRSLLALGLPLESSKCSRRYSALALAICDNDLENARVLLDHGVDVNARDEEGKTALHYVEPSDLQSVNLLVSRGADANATDITGITPLMTIWQKIIDTKGSWRLWRQPLFAENAERVIERLLSCTVDLQASASNVENSILLIGESYYRSYWMQPVLAQLVLIQARGIPVERDIMNKINDYILTKEYFEKCVQRLKEMKQAKVWRSITLYELLIASPDKIECYMRNDRLSLNLHRIKYKNQFMPYYVYVLRDRIQTAVRVVSVRKEVAAILCRASGLGQNSFCIDTGYLGENDLRKFYRDE